MEIKIRPHVFSNAKSIYEIRVDENVVQNLLSTPFELI